MSLRIDKIKLRLISSTLSIAERRKLVAEGEALGRAVQYLQNAITRFYNEFYLEPCEWKHRQSVTLIEYLKIFGLLHVFEKVLGCKFAVDPPSKLTRSSPRVLTNADPFHPC